jgi:hypothetical protein
MAYDEVLAERIRTALCGRDDVLEKKMFGGITFMVAGRIACGVVHDDLMVRVGPDGHDEAVAQPHVRPMDVTGKRRCGGWSTSRRLGLRPTTISGAGWTAPSAWRRPRVSPQGAQCMPVHDGLVVRRTENRRSSEA